jgi:hypothetical protein
LRTAEFPVHGGRPQAKPALGSPSLKPEYLKAMRKAHILGALVRMEAVTAEGLEAVFKDFNLSGDNLVHC